MNHAEKKQAILHIMEKYQKEMNREEFLDVLIFLLVANACNVGHTSPDQVLDKLIVYWLRMTGLLAQEVLFDFGDDDDAPKA